MARCVGASLPRSPRNALCEVCPRLSRRPLIGCSYSDIYVLRTLGLVEYLRELGIGSLYLSPFFRARRGSTHGYDMVDPSQVDPSLGTEEEFGALARTIPR